MNCPYDPTHENTAKPQGSRMYAKCPICGQSARARIYNVGGQDKYELVKAGRGKSEPTKVFSKRLTASQVVEIENGRAVLTLTNNCLQLQYIT